MMPFHGRCGIQTTQWRLIFDHERVVVTAMIDVVNDTRKIQRNFLRKEIEVFLWLVVRSNIIAPLRRMLEDNKSIQSNIAYRTGRQFPPGRGVRIGDDKNAAFYMSVEPHKRSELKTSYFEAGFHYRQSRCRSRNLRLVFTIDRVGVGVVIRSVELYDLLKTAFWFRWRSSENWLVGVACRSGKTKPIRTKRGNVHCDWFILPLGFCFRLRQSDFH